MFCQNIEALTHQGNVEEVSPYGRDDGEYFVVHVEIVAEQLDVDGAGGPLEDEGRSGKLLQRFFAERTPIPAFKAKAAVAGATGRDGELYVVGVFAVEHEGGEEHLRSLLRQGSVRTEVRIAGPESLDFRRDVGENRRFGCALPKALCRDPDDVLEPSFALAEEQGIDEAFSYLAFFDLDEGSCGHRARSAEKEQGNVRALQPFGAAKRDS